LVLWFLVIPSTPSAAATVATAVAISISIGAAIGHVGFDQNADCFVPSWDFSVRGHIAAGTGVGLVGFEVEIVVEVIFGGVRGSGALVARGAKARRLFARGAVGSGTRRGRFVAIATTATPTTARAAAAVVVLVARGTLGTRRIAVGFITAVAPLASLVALWWCGALASQVGVEVELGVTLDIEIGIFAGGLDIGLVSRRRIFARFSAAAATAATATTATTAMAVALARFIGGCAELTRLVRAERQVGTRGFRDVVIDHRTDFVVLAAGRAAGLAQARHVGFFDAKSEYVEIGRLGSEYFVE